MSNLLSKAATVAAALAAVLAVLGTRPVMAAEATVRPALDAVFAAFQTHPLVALGDAHGMAQEADFYDALVRDPRFAAEVGNVVVEFGSSAHQDTLDRYLNGEEVPYAELREVWSEVVGWVPTVIWAEYPNFFAQVRAVNQALPPDRRIRVWLGEPPLDWSTVRTRDEIFAVGGQKRDDQPAAIIDRQIMARGKKALIIYGTLHFFSIPQPAALKALAPPRTNLKEAIERAHPGALYVIAPYVGYPTPACSAAFEAEMKWPKAVVVSSTAGTAVERALLRPGCDFALPRFPDPQPPAAELASLQKEYQAISTGAAADALLYLGPAAGLMQSPIDPGFVLDDAYFREISRRYALRLGRPLAWAEWAARASLPPQPYKAQ